MPFKQITVVLATVSDIAENWDLWIPFAMGVLSFLASLIVPDHITLSGLQWLNPLRLYDWPVWRLRPFLRVLGTLLICVSVLAFLVLLFA